MTEECCECSGEYDVFDFDNTMGLTMAVRGHPKEVFAIRINEDRETYTDTFMCGRCLKKKMNSWSTDVTTCSECGKITTNPRQGLDFSLCNECFHKSYTSCDECGSTIDLNNLREEPERDLCDRCYIRHFKAPTKTRWTAIFDTDNLTIGDSLDIFGVEIESLVEEPYDVDNQYLERFKAVNDYSLNVSGKEFVSAPLRYGKHFNVIKRFSRKFARKHLTVDASCGFHLHIYIHPDIFKNLETMKKLMYGYIMSEPYFFDLVPKSRRNNRFCKSLWDDLKPEKVKKEDSLNGLMSGFYNHDLSSLQNIPKEKRPHINPSSRQYWVNFHALFYLNTLEIRLHSSTCDDEKILNWYKLHRDFLWWLIDNDESKVFELNNNNFRDKMENEIIREDGVLEWTRKRREKFKGGYQCNNCDEKFDNMRKLRNHTCDDGNAHACIRCGKLFKTRTDLVIHEHKDHNIKDIIHKCNHCDEEFITLSAKAFHTTTEHDASFKYMCLECSEEFESVRGYTIHYRREHNEPLSYGSDEFERYFCEICEDTFPTLKSLAVHWYDEHNYRVCPVCSYEADNIIGLLKHIKKNHEEGDELGEIVERPIGEDRANTNERARERWEEIADTVSITLNDEEESD